jgi:hypothetical protein
MMGTWKCLSVFEVSDDLRELGTTRIVQIYIPEKLTYLSL